VVVSVEIDRDIIRNVEGAEHIETGLQESL
jgi:hypothetical protein